LCKGITLYEQKNMSHSHLLFREEDQVIHHGKPIKNGFHSHCAFIDLSDFREKKRDEDEDQFRYHEKPIKWILLALHFH
jgi:hypothetical protein